MQNYRAEQISIFIRKKYLTINALLPSFFDRFAPKDVHSPTWWRERKGLGSTTVIFTYFLPVPWKPNSKATDVQMFENIWIPAGLAAGLHQLQIAKFYKYC